MTRSHPTSRATDTLRFGHAATAGLPSVYRVHALAMQERLQAFAVQEAAIAQLRQATTASAVPAPDHAAWHARLTDWLHRQLHRPVVGPVVQP